MSEWLDEAIVEDLIAVYEGQDSTSGQTSQTGSGSPNSAASSRPSASSYDVVQTESELGSSSVVP